MPKLSIYWLLGLTPLTVFINTLPDVSKTLIFFLAGAALIPIATLLVHATEELATKVGDALGGLLNATFGNAPELIISFAALRLGNFEIVKGSLIGAILANLLLGQGLAFLLGGMRYHDQHYNAAGTRTYGTVMLIAVLSLAIPSTFAKMIPGESGVTALNNLNLTVAFLLLFTYALYLVFMLRTHPNFFVTQEKGETTPSPHGSWSTGRAMGALVVASVMAAFMSEILVGAAEETGSSLGLSQTFLGIIFLAAIGGAAELAAAVSAAQKNRMDLSIGIALGSSIQIALFVAPVLVLISYLVSPAPLNLTFGSQSLSFLLISVLIGAFVTSDGSSNWYKGSQLLIVYLMLAAMLYMIPMSD